ncbi:Impact family protein [Talaromyces stipitatus ATCC 10500]|uniref:Impact family protein n=1 Tax=Talaromyces stipitatus (strain ATCC 10500 / CBS 375.48 / QM 6759 / NRRL 1006) TaxID=441959 RepID=B8MBJ4_TALSN|nr:Impact family protein [Talaromyces stipitatus ATCC 10500]EED17858.1 Impact family protein [Talaromyces stipitatus ATCC 10500]
MSSALENLQQRELAEEIEAINAIYEPDTIEINTISSASDNVPRTLDLGGTDNSTAAITTTIRLRIPEHPHLSFIFGFDDEYPETPPRVVGTASTSSRGEGSLTVDVLRDIVSRAHQPGQVCLFEVISEATEKFSELSIGGTTDPENASRGNETPVGEHATDDQVDQTADNFMALSLKDSFGIDSPPDWILSDIVTEKKSVFVGRAAKAYLDYLLATDKKVASATHNISAWRIRERKDDNIERIFQDCDDDGETAAGGRLLHLMQLMDVWDVLVVVTRWYGGILLGPDRFRIINNVGKDALIKAGFQRDASSAKDKGKKKGKK